MAELDREDPKPLQLKPVCIFRRSEGYALLEWRLVFTPRTD